MLTQPRIFFVAIAAVFLSTFCLLYLPTHCASVYMDDSGETVTVCATLSIGHPPGYPLHTLLGHLFTRTFPWGDVAVRMNIFAGVLGSLCVALLFALLCRLQAVPWQACLAAGLALAAGPVFWHNALGAKGSIYMLNNALSAACLLLLVWDPVLSLRRRQLFWLCFGLALANHYMSQLVLFPAYAWLLMAPSGPSTFKRLWIGLARRATLWCVVGCSLYLYLYLRSLNDLALDWGRIRSWPDFFFFLFRAQYAAGEGGRSLAVVARQALHALMLCLKEGAWALTPLALYALWKPVPEARRLAIALALGWLGCLAAVTFYLNLSVERLDIMRPYLFPAYLCQAGLAALGLVKLLRQLPWQRLATALVLFASLLPAGLGWNAQDLSQYHYAVDMARNVLQSLPRQAMLLATGDALIFPLWYVQRLKHERPDVAVVGTAVLPMDWVRQDLAERHPTLRQPRLLRRVGAEAIDELTRAYLELNSGLRPLYSTFNQLGGGVRGWALMAEGPVYQAWSEAQGPPKHWTRAKAEAGLAAASQRGYFGSHLDPHTTLLAVHDFGIHHNSLGTRLEDQKDLPGALEHFRLAQVYAPQSEEFPYNEGNILHQQELLQPAIAAYRHSLAISPVYINAWFNLAVTQYKLGQRVEAAASFREILRLDPARSDVAQLIQQYRL